MVKSFALVALIATSLVAAVYATAGDTWTADLAGNTLPPQSTLQKGKGSGTMTLTEQPGNLYLWEIDLFRTGEWFSLEITNSAATTVLTFQSEIPWTKDDIVFYGNFTKDYLDQQLATNGFTANDLYGGNDLYVVARLANNTAVAGPVSSNAIADFNYSAPSPSGSVDDVEVTTNVVYVAQMQNTSLQYFESGIPPSNGTGSFLLQDMLDGTYNWNLDTTNFRRPANLTLNYFANMSSQPIVMHLIPDPPLKDKVDSYSGNFTYTDLVNGLNAIGDVPPKFMEKTLNYTPPRLLVKLDDTRNTSVVGFIFDANAAPTEKPIVKGAADLLTPGQWTMMAVLVALLLL